MNFELSAVVIILIGVGGAVAGFRLRVILLATVAALALLTGLHMLGGKASAATLAGCSVTDGDTIRCGAERIRLLAVDAPDDPGNSRCRPVPKPGATCDRQRAAASKAALQRIMTGPLSIERVGVDPYGRTLAMVYGQGRSFSCRQIEGGQAVYVARWDQGGRVARECPLAATGAAR